MNGMPKPYAAPAHLDKVAVPDVGRDQHVVLLELGDGRGVGFGHVRMHRLPEQRFEHLYQCAR